MKFISEYIFPLDFFRKTNQSTHMEITSCELFNYKACVSQLRISKNFNTSWIESWSKKKNAPTSYKTH